MLEVQDLSVQLAAARVLQNVDFKVSDGELVGIIGPNGAGKSTILNAIAGRVAVASGAVRVRDESWNRLPPYRRAQRGMAYVPEGRGLVRSLSVKDNLALVDSPLDGDVEEEVFDMLPALRSRMNVPLGLLSGGEQQAVALLRALRPAARLVLLDEPTLGLAPEIINRCSTLLRNHARRERAALVVEQNAKFCFDLCDRVLLLQRGRIVREFSGGPHDVDVAEFLGTQDVVAAGPDHARDAGWNETRGET